MSLRETADVKISTLSETAAKQKLPAAYLQRNIATQSKAGVIRITTAINVRTFGLKNMTQRRSLWKPLRIRTWKS